MRNWKLALVDYLEIDRSKSKEEEKVQKS